MTGNVQLVGLDEVIAKRNGSVDPAKFPNETFELLSIPAFDSGRPEITVGAEIGSTKQVVQEGDVLLSKIVPHIRRAWVVKRNTSHRLIASGEWIVFRDPRFDPDYLRHLLTADGFHRQFMQTVSGVGGSLLRARPSEVAKIKVPLPPKKEQQRIAAILDKANRLRHRRLEAIRLADEFLQATFFGSFGDADTNHRDWPVVRLEEVALQVTDGEHQTPQRSSEGIYLLSARNVQNGFLALQDVDYVPQDEFERIRRRCDPKKGDILISCSGSIGRVAQVPSDEPLALVRSVALVRPDTARVRSCYLEHLLRSAPMQRRMVAASKSSAQANLFQGPIRALPVILPPIEDQVRFERIVARVLSLGEKSAVALEDLSVLSRSLQSNLLQSGLAQ